MEVGKLHLMFDHQIDRGLIEGKVRINFYKRSKVFWGQEGHQQAHGYGGGEKEDKEDDGMVCVCVCVLVAWRWRRGGEDGISKIFVEDIL